MTATTTRTPSTTTTKPSTRSLILTGLAAAVVAAAATMAVAAGGSAAGISLDVNGAALPVASFGMLTLVFSLVGLVLAVVLSRTVKSPRRAFVRTTVVLTVLSLVPDVMVDAEVGTKALLMLTHLVAAAIVIPAVARRLSA
jgi:ABC-type transport system involved in multi-copper enzyme maturation permease subunit